MPIAVPDFIAGSGETGQVATDIADVVRADLERSGLFRPIRREAIFGTPGTTEVVPNFEPFRLVKAQALVIGAATIDGDELTVDFRLWDVFAGRSMTGLRLTAGLSSWRRVAHKVADAIYERVTGEVGYFDTRLVFISESGPLLGPWPDLWIDRGGWILNAAVSATAVANFGGAIKFPLSTLSSFPMPRLSNFCSPR